MAKKATEELAVISIPKIELATIDIKIIGDSPLIVHKWSHKAKQEMLGKQMKKASAGKDAKDPEYDFYESLYWLNAGVDQNTTKEEYATLLKSGEARFGFPSVAFKACAINAGYQQGAIAKKTTYRGAFHLDDEFVEIFGTPNIREDMVKIGGMTKVADIRYRGEFRDWWAILHINYNVKVVTPEQIFNLVNLGGFACGVGEWRPERDGSFGRFHVALAGE